MFKKKIIITGGAGFIGSSFAEFLNNKLKHYEIILFDKKKFFNKNKLVSKNNKIKYIQGNTINFDRYFKNMINIETIFHFGEFSRIVQSFNYTKECFVSNGIATFNVINFCKKKNIKLVYSASSSKFGNKGKDENLSPYSWTKSKNIELIRNYNKWFNLDYEIVYFSNVYGGNHIRTGKLATVIAIFEDQYLKKKPLTVVGNGKQKRDFTHISDIVRGTYYAWNKNKKKEYLLYSGDNLSIISIAKMFNCQIKHIPERQGERLDSIKPNFKKKIYLPFRAKIKLKDYIKKFINAQKKK